MQNNTPFLMINQAGWPFIAIFAVITLILGSLSGPLFFIGLVLTGWCMYFFRDPPRTVPTREGLVVSPADGKVVIVSEVVPEPELGIGDERRMRVSIFLNVFDVHINRAPIGGTVSSTHYREGKFLHAASDKASVDNERMAVAITMNGDHPYAGKEIGVVQIAGLIARRIICNVSKGSFIRSGERFGLIRFGSRTDLYLPPGVQPLVSVGQYMVGGETVIADLKSGEAQRGGEIR